MAAWEFETVGAELEALANQSLTQLSNIRMSTLREKLVEGLAAAKLLGHPVGQDYADKRTDFVGADRRQIDQAIDHLADSARKSRWR